MSQWNDWNTVDTFPYKGFDARLSYTHEDTPIGDAFPDDDIDNILEMQNNIDNDEAFWIIAKVELFLGTVCIGESYLGGIYVETLDELKQYYLEDLCYESYNEAQYWYNENKGILESYEFSIKD